MATIDTPNPYNPNRSFQVQGVVLLDPVTGLPAGIGNSTVDSTGTYFNPESCSSVVGRDASGNIITETLTDDVHTWVKTHTWSNGLWAGESKWVKQ